ncbi:MAG: cell envelope integrity EipB family protein [Rhodospirillaceae bacterium]|nr:cell envelope integrity EipB family protein [Rhodospirillaceae bacterium]
MTFLNAVRRFAPACLAVLASGAALAAGPALKGAAATTAAAEKQPATLISHRAVYDLSLSKVSQSDGVRAASGTMTYTLTDRCDGYTIETNLSMDLAFANGADNQVEQRYAAWEAKDGRSSTFRFQVIENGNLAKSYHGDIQFKDDGTGTATYESDETTKFELPRGTLLSTAHTLELLKSAGAQERFVSKLVIDGSFDEGPFWVTAAIAPAHQSPVSPAKAGALDEGRYWPIGMAYFPMASSGELPEYEITQNLFNTGITHSMAQDFGGFTLAFKPVRVEPVSVAACP